MPRCSFVVSKDELLGCGTPLFHVQELSSHVAQSWHPESPDGLYCVAEHFAHSIPAIKPHPAQVQASSVVVDVHVFAANAGNDNITQKIAENMNFMFLFLYIEE